MTTIQSFDSKFLKKISRLFIMGFIESVIIFFRSLLYGKNIRVLEVVNLFQKFVTKNQNGKNKGT